MKKILYMFFIFLYALAVSSQNIAERQGILDNQIFTVNGVTFAMVAVEGGTFTMGDSDEKPMHSVTLSSFYIGQTEVTQALWQAVMGNNPSYYKGDSKPVEQVSWNDCQTFVSTLNSLTGKNFRLPTEAEWEYAARGGRKSRGYKYSGSNSIGDVAWYYDNSMEHGSRITHPVATKQPNELGIYDMSGNVYEWCSDWFGRYSSGAQTNPQGASNGVCRVVRGGCWDYSAEYCGVSNRYINVPDGLYYYLGMRLVLPQ